MIQNKSKSTKNLNGSIIFLFIFFAVGIAGFLLPATHNLFVKLIPLALLISGVFLFYFHEKYNSKTIIIFLIVYILGLTVEIIGVNTKLIFGDYTYGNGLGIKIFKTPLIIGLNWLMLVYMSMAVIRRLTKNKIMQAIFAASVLLIYDLVLEQVAPALNMWFWNGDIIPLQNYAAWYIIALFFNVLFIIFKIKTVNKIAPFVLLFQFSFFVILLFTK